MIPSLPQLQRGVTHLHPLLDSDIPVIGLFQMGHEGIPISWGLCVFWGKARMFYSSIRLDF